MEDSAGTSATVDNSLSNSVFIGVVSSVGSLILVIALVMIAIFSCLCLREYLKRRALEQKRSDRVGLLHNKTEAEDVVSDNEASCKAVQDESMFAMDKPQVALATSKRSSKVSPADSALKASKKRGSSSQESARMVESVCMEGEEEEEEKVAYSKIDEVEEAGGGGAEDESGDEVQLIQAKKEKPKKTKKKKAMDLTEKADMLGRTLGYMEKLSRSSRLDAESLRTLSDKEIMSQYKDVPTNSAELPHQPAAEREKNRYRNVLPNLHSLVPLKFTGAEGSTYINANFIRGLHDEAKAFIASQGPLFETMPDFWRMVWEHNVSVIIMLTNFIENGRHKCVKYWPPAEGKDKIVYGDFEVMKRNEEEVPSCYTLTQLSIKNMQTQEVKYVDHFWYTSWPDFGIPKVAEPILKLREAVDQRRRSGPSNTGPVVVHCSAGLGRSGTFIAVDMGIQQYLEEGVVDPLKYLCEMRQDRGGMIQTQDQYKFVHQALVEYQQQTH